MITCQFEHGNTASLRHAVVDVLIVENNKILLVKRALHLSNPGKFAVPGGYVNRDETCEDAAKREAREETGYEVNIEKFLEVVDNPNRAGEDRQNISFVYLAHPLEKVSTPDDEQTEVTWFDLDNLPKEDEFAFDHFERVKKFLL
jgi:8-oxo-dGTP diphosphatase